MEKNKKKKNGINSADKTKKYKALDEKTEQKVKSKKAKKDKKEKKKHPKLRLAIKIILLVFALFILIGAGIVAGILTGFFGDDFKLTEEELKVGNLNTEIYDRGGELIATLNGEEKRKWIDLGDMPDNLVKAFVAIEDERFYQHHGVDIQRTASATIKYLLSKIGIGEEGHGGSTITQQLIKNLTNENKRDWTRKVKEIARAYNLEKELSKNQILELYLNLIFFGGSNIHGVELGAQYYFNKSAKDLDLAECAFLAGINNSPNIYDPFHTDKDRTDEEDNERIRIRVKTVLAKMKEQKENLEINFTDEEYNAAVAKVDAGLTFTKGNITQNIYSYHTDAAIEEIIKQLMTENPDWSYVRAEQYLYGGGFKIYTTQNTWVQGILEEEVKNDVYQVASRKIEGEVSQVAMVIIDHTTGQVIATVGGSGEKNTSRGLNIATQSTKQTGSSMKPIGVIAPAVENGIITAGSVYDDAPVRYGSYVPKNYYRGFKGLSTVRYAIEISQNIVPIKILNELGLEKSRAFLESVGVTSITDADMGVAQLALGGLTNGISPLQMAGAYAAIANDGEYITPTFYTKVTDKDGNTILTPKQEKRRVMSVENAYIVKSILTQPVVGGAGTATYCKIPNIDTAAKTGTTDKDWDRWLCGFTPYFTAATWFGYKENETVRFYGQRGNPAGQVWERVMKATHNGLEAKKFEKPENITYATICKDSGLRATALCAQDARGNRTYTEVFVKGTVPSKTCDCHQAINVCEEDGVVKLANEFCPNAVERVFITRKNSDQDTSWKSAADAKYMPPTEKCTIHTKPVNKNNTVTNNTTTNNTITNNTITNNTTNNNTVTNNTTTNKPTNNSTTNNTNKNNTTTNDTNKNNTNKNNTNKNNTTTNNTNKNNTATNETNKPNKNTAN